MSSIQNNFQAKTVSASPTGDYLTGLFCLYFTELAEEIEMNPSKRKLSDELKKHFRALLNSNGDTRLDDIFRGFAAGVSCAAQFTDDELAEYFETVGRDTRL